MGKSKPLKDRLWGAAVLKMSFRLRGAEASSAFRSIYPGVLRDLELTDDEVEAFIKENQQAVEEAGRGTSP